MDASKASVSGRIRTEVLVGHSAGTGQSALKSNLWYQSVQKWSCSEVELLCREESTNNNGSGLYKEGRKMRT
jgi:hypothetical protein